MINANIFQCSATKLHITLSLPLSKQPVRSLWAHKKRPIFLEVLKPEIRLWKTNKKKKKKNLNPNNQRTLQLQGLPQLKAHCRNATSCISILFILRVPHQVKSNAEIVRKLSVIRSPMPDLSREGMRWHSSHSTKHEPGLCMARSYRATESNLSLPGVTPSVFSVDIMCRDFACYWEKRDEKPSG